ncbi:hypothetical protein BKI52_32130 [marine bacterium AO1-C]|nr:hypothetical protein BKI52_32130 [marine bacterium AO1-C]
MKQLVILALLSAFFYQCTYSKDPSLNFFDKSPPPSYSRLTKVLGYQINKYILPKEADHKILNKPPHYSNLPHLLIKELGDTTITYNYSRSKKCVLSKQISIPIESEKKALNWIKQNGGKVKDIITQKMPKPWNDLYKQLIVINTKGQEFECSYRKKYLKISTIYDCISS